MYYAKKGNLAIAIEECEAFNPRSECDNLGTMICFHRRYSLGDKHNWKEPEDFYRALYREVIPDEGEQLIAFLKSDADTARLSEENGEYILEEKFSWRGDWTETMRFPKADLKTNLDDLIGALTVSELEKLLASVKEMVFMPLWLYDHSGLSISCGSFVGRAPHAEWDSGRIGVIYATPEEIKKEYGDDEKALETAKEVLEGEVKEYDLYLRGECYCCRAFKDGTEINSVWGLLGDIDDVKTEIEDCLPEEYGELLNGELTYSDKTPEFA